MPPYRCYSFRRNISIVSLTQIILHIRSQLYLLRHILYISFYRLGWQTHVRVICLFIMTNNIAFKTYSIQTLDLSDKMKRTPPCVLLTEAMLLDFNTTVNTSSWKLSKHAFLSLGVLLILRAQRANKQVPTDNKSVIKCTKNVLLSWIARQCQLPDILAEFLWKWLLRSQKGTRSIKWHKTYQTSWVTNAKTGSVA